MVDLIATTPTIHIITKPSIKAGYPDWSPDGNLIVFHAGNLDPFAEGGAQSDIYVIVPDGTDLRRVNQPTAAGTKYALPSWSTDGRNDPDHDDLPAARLPNCATRHEHRHRR